jgi:hypothetical protein
MERNEDPKKAQNGKAGRFLGSKLHQSQAKEAMDFESASGQGKLVHLRETRRPLQNDLHLLIYRSTEFWNENRNCTEK